MDSIEDTLIHNSMTYLNDIGTYINIGKSTDMLKSYYLNKCNKVVAREGLDLHEKLQNDTVRCPKCCNAYIDSVPKCSIVPEKHKSKFGRRIIKKNPNKLTRFQRKYIKCVSSIRENSILITCNFCSNKIKKRLPKPIMKIPAKIIETSKRSKKKRRKDKFSGLKAEAVLAASPKLVALNIVSITTPEVPISNKMKNKLKRMKQKEMEPIKKTNKEIRTEKNKINQKMNKLNNMLNSSNISKKVGLKQFLDSMQ